MMVVGLSQASRQFCPNCVFLYAFLKRVCLRMRVNDPFIKGLDLVKKPCAMLSVREMRAKFHCHFRHCIPSAVLKCRSFFHESNTAKLRLWRSGLGVESCATVDVAWLIPCGEQNWKRLCLEEVSDFV